jgi:hypothetical protein
MPRRDEPGLQDNLNESIDGDSVKSTAPANPTNNIPIINSTNINAASSVVDNAKYISNLRLELKTKHARHVQDLKDYYEKEIDELNRKLAYFKSTLGGADKKATKSMANMATTTTSGSSSEYDYVEDFEMNAKLYENLAKTNEDYLKLNNELNNANSKLLDKLVCSFAYILLAFFYVLILFNSSIGF